MPLHQREALSVVEFAVEEQRLDPEVEGIDEAQKLREDAAGDVAVGETAHG